MRQANSRTRRPPEEGLFGAAEELSDEQVFHQVQTDPPGSIQVVRAALPHLRAQGGGHMQIAETVLCGLREQPESLTP